VSRGYPSMTALLAVLAIAGYQNRDKIAEWVKSAQGKLDSPSRGSGASAGGGPPGNLGGALAGRSIGDLLSNGLRDLVDSFKQAGMARQPIRGSAMARTSKLVLPIWKGPLGQTYWRPWSQQTGLSREEILSRLSKNLPDAVDKYTPQGRIPTAAELG